MNPCKNCGHSLYDLYCSHCGQKASVQRISLSYFWHDLLHFFTHMDSGFLFTSGQMIKDPGNTVRQFISGKRKTYQSPISYFLIWITIYILLLFSIEKLFGENVVINYREYFGPASATKFAISHLSLVLIFVIPFQALYLYLLVTRKEYNYIETLVATIYCLGTIILFQFLFAMFALIIYGITGSSTDLRISDILKILYLAWFIAHFIKPFRVTHPWLSILVFAFLAFGTFTIWRLYGFPWLIEIFSGQNH
jgi:Protein of unknown function (DUF3667)